MRRLALTLLVMATACGGPREIDEQLAEHGDTAAMHRLCFDLTYGEHGSVQDWEVARTWCGRGAKAGEPSSQVLYGELLQYGQGGTRDLDSAHYWYIQAANQRHPYAPYAMALLYLRNEVPAPVPGMAEALLDSAAAWGYEPAKELRDCLLAGCQR